MTVEAAPAERAGARTGPFPVRDEDGLWTGLAARAQLPAVRGSAAYDDRIRPRAAPGDRGPFAPPLTTTTEAEHAMRHRRPDVPPVPPVLPLLDAQGSAPGALALAR
ncbi:CBS domain-containing protein [Streptomyces roseolus]